MFLNAFQEVDDLVRPGGFTDLAPHFAMLREDSQFWSPVVRVQVNFDVFVNRVRVSKLLITDNQTECKFKHTKHNVLKGIRISSIFQFLTLNKADDARHNPRLSL
jgi:hypothetical protein